MRQVILNKKMADSFGRGTPNPFNNVQDVLSPYYFSIVLENIDVDNYFSEKVSNAISCGCVPIYKGCTNIEKYLNIDGILSFNTIAELESILTEISPDMYMEMYDALKENFNIINDQHYTTEDWLYSNYLGELYD